MSDFKKLANAIWDCKLCSAAHNEGIILFGYPNTDEIGKCIYQANKEKPVLWAGPVFVSFKFY